MIFGANDHTTLEAVVAYLLKEQADERRRGGLMTKKAYAAQCDHAASFLDAIIWNLEQACAVTISTGVSRRAADEQDRPEGES